MQLGGGPSILKSTQSSDDEHGDEEEDEDEEDAKFTSYTFAGAHAVGCFDGKTMNHLTLMLALRQSARRGRGRCERTWIVHVF